LRTSSGPSGAHSRIALSYGYPGGIGLARKALTGLDRLATIALARLRQCRCQSESGCPSCVYDRNCGNDNQPMDRLAAIIVLEAILPAEPQSNSA
jgi:DEAD/DEAH box helicase domain-containing protein